MPKSLLYQLPKTGPNWVAIQRFDPDLQPIPNTPYKITYATGEVFTGTLDAKGYARHDNVPDGQAKVTYEDPPIKEEKDVLSLNARLNKLTGGSHV